jgi:hypothetical protein
MSGLVIFCLIFAGLKILRLVQLIILAIKYEKQGKELDNSTVWKHIIF